MSTGTDARLDLAATVQSLPWIHTIDLGHGVVTPGAWPPSPLILHALDYVDFRGRKVLDIGCWDGLWSFAAEKRGAREVHASDDISQRPHSAHPTFQCAHAALHSQVHYHPNLSVYDLSNWGERDFDIVLFFGVYYHLRHPLLALERIHDVLRPGGTLIIEGEVLHARSACRAEFLHHHVHKNDPTNWWLPTVPCLHQWLQSCHFEVVRHFDVATTPFDQSLWSVVKCLLKRRLGLGRPVFSRHVAIASKQDIVSANPAPTKHTGNTAYD